MKRTSALSSSIWLPQIMLAITVVVDATAIASFSLGLGLVPLILGLLAVASTGITVSTLRHPAGRRTARTSPWTMVAAAILIPVAIYLLVVAVALSSWNSGL